MSSSSKEICSIKLLPKNLWVSAAAKAAGVNPANAPAMFMLTQAVPGEVLPPEHLALLTAKYWGKKGVKLTVSFLDGAPADLRTRIVSHMNAWSEFANVQ